MAKVLDISGSPDAYLSARCWYYASVSIDQNGAGRENIFGFRVAKSGYMYLLSVVAAFAAPDLELSFSSYRSDGARGR